VVVGTVRKSIDIWGWPDIAAVFLRFLTQNRDGELMAVDVSGYDGDGAAALCGTKDAGGI
jgi:hypothetical protein